MDLIERQRVLNYCEALINAENTDGDEWSHSYARERVSQTEVIMDFVDALPSAQPDATIEKENALNLLNGIHSSGRMDYYSDYCSLFDAISNIPSAQPEPSQVARDIATIIENEQDMRVILSQPEIVRCKHCKHWKNKHLCESLSRYGSFETKADFYCGYAERREDGQI